VNANKCKICRQLGVKTFLKGDRCFSIKCAMIKRAYPPGPKKKRRTRGLSEYGKQLKEKQKLKRWYNLGERQFRRYIKETLAKRPSKTEDAPTILIRTLESRLDNVIFRSGLASSRPQARQMVSHAHLLVNGKPVDVPSYLVKKNDRITAKPQFSKKKGFEIAVAEIKKKRPPAWIELDTSKLEVKIIGAPSFDEAAPPADIASIFGFYSR